MPLDGDVDLDQLARGTPGFSGAELYNLMNTAALKSSVEGLKNITMSSLEFAKDKIMMGAERKSAIISKETLKMTAYHEAGHALVALKTASADPIHKATIMPRGRALGMVMQLPDGDQTSMSKQQMLARMDVCMGGRVAEEIIYGKQQVTSGASNDLQQATRIARNMVLKYGLSDKIGFVYYDEKLPLSMKQLEEIDEEIQSILNQSYQRAKAILEFHRAELEIIAKGLLEYESLSGQEIVDLTEDKSLIHLKKRSQKPSRPAQQLSLIQDVIGANNNNNNSNKNQITAENENNNNNNNNNTSQNGNQKDIVVFIDPVDQKHEKLVDGQKVTNPGRNSRGNTNNTDTVPSRQRGPPKV
jgi:ATP-dependent Zn protease